MDRVLVVGGSNEHIQLLSEITDPRALAELETETDPTAFKSFLQRMLPKKLERAAAKPQAYSRQPNA